ncbi:chemotaxis protein, partial [Allorhizobium sp. BGMRC 0089]|nr:chemotaxis protein [Allorhizobium sonneratiae]
EQDTTIRSIATALNQLDTATQQNAAMAEETRRSGETLSQDTRDLIGLMGSFKISDGQTSSLSSQQNWMRKTG